jgi:hypothetical protein
MAILPTLQYVDFPPRTPSPGLFRTNPVQSRTQNTPYCTRMPPAKDQARAPLPTPQREISPVFTLMPTFSGYLKRTSGRQLLLLVMTNIATFTAAWTFPRTRSDAKPSGIHKYASLSDANKHLNTLQPDATIWSRADKERQPGNVPHRLPFHKPDLAVVDTTWRPRDCIPQVEKHLRSLGSMPLHFTNPQKTDIRRTTTTTELMRNCLQYPVQRSTTTGRLPHSTRTAALSTFSYDSHRIFDINIKSWKKLANTRIPEEAGDSEHATV